MRKVFTDVADCITGDPFDVVVSHITVYSLFQATFLFASKLFIFNWT
jgi:hypothetical protein